MTRQGSRNVAKADREATAKYLTETARYFRQRVDPRPAPVFDALVQLACAVSIRRARLAPQVITPALRDFLIEQARDCDRAAERAAGPLESRAIEA